MGYDPGIRERTVDSAKAPAQAERAITSGPQERRRRRARMKVTRRELLKGAALGVAAAVPQFVPAAAQAQTTQKKELVVAQGGDIARFDPHFSTASNDIRWSFNVFDNLTSRHPDGKLYPGLATEWKLEGQSTYRFKLREGVKFHNGDPFTSAD